MQSAPLRRIQCDDLVQVLRVIGRCSEATAKECFGDQQFATTLVATLDDPNTAVRAALCFAVCNLCATASCPARQLLLDKVRRMRPEVAQALPGNPGRSWPFPASPGHSRPLSSRIHNHAHACPVPPRPAGSSSGTLLVPLYVCDGVTTTMARWPRRVFKGSGGHTAGKPPQGVGPAVWCGADLER